MYGTLSVCADYHVKRLHVVEDFVLNLQVLDYKQNTCHTVINKLREAGCYLTKRYCVKILSGH